MTIKRILIRNFRSIVEREFVLPEPGQRFVIYGANGTGKTSVLESCQLALGMKVTRNPPPGQNYYVELDVKFGSSGYRIIKTPMRHEVIGEQLTIEGLAIREDRRFAAKNRAKMPWEEFSALAFSSWRAPILRDKLNLVVGKGRTPDKNDENALIRLQQYYVNLLGVKAINPTMVDDKLKLLNEAWRCFYPGSVDCFSPEPIGSPAFDHSDVDAIEGFNLFLVKDDSRYPVNELSSGEIEVLSMLGALIIEKQYPDVVFIDEPELHLNQVWHRAIVKALSKFAPKTQFIVATHSMEVWDSVYSDEHVIMEK